MNNIAYLNDYVILDDDNPIGYTYDIYSCIGLLIHRKNSAVIGHIEAYTIDNKVNINEFKKMIRLDDDEILFVEIFKGPITNLSNVNTISKILNDNNISYVIYNSYMNIYGKGSIGYNYNTGKYYKVGIDYELEEVMVPRLTK